MNEREKLILRLGNLKKNKSKDITLGIDYLLNILGEPMPAVEVRKTETVKRASSVEVDGGGFIED